MRRLQLRSDSDPTAFRPRYDRSTTYITTGLLHCDLNKQIGHVTAACGSAARFTSQCSRTRVESKSNRYRIVVVTTA